LTPRAAYEIERNQIEEKLGLDSMVSLTDHDNIEAPLNLRLLREGKRIPLSLEWTVPYEGAIVHLGMHNLPNGAAKKWLLEMQRYSSQTSGEQLAELLSGLHAIEDALIVLNHPLWDLHGIGQQAHQRALHHFLSKHNQFIHAFELGGLRSWEENQRVLDLAHKWDQIAISGGDRHGCEPSAVLNLTNATTFSEFVVEIRRHRRSTLLFMPQYQQSVIMRMIRTLNDVVGDIPEHPIGAHWDDRTFHPDATGVMRPLSELWDKAPRFIAIAFAMARLFEAQPVQAISRRLWNGSRNAFRLDTLRRGGETA
jgi:hypothetical protein